MYDTVHKIISNQGKILEYVVFIDGYIKAVDDHKIPEKSLYSHPRVFKLVS